MPDSENIGMSNTNQNPTSEFDDIPYENLRHFTRELTRRINNPARQQLEQDLRESGHLRSIKLTAPIILYQFIACEIDLDTTLSQLFPNAPLLSHVRFIPPPNEPVRRRATAIFSSNDASATMTVDAHVINRSDAALEFTFTILGALALRFRLAPLLIHHRERWLDSMQQESQVVFFWTHERWERPYVVFVRRESFAYLYAFSPHGLESSARMTPDMIGSMLGWLEGLWFPERKAETDELEHDTTASDTLVWGDAMPTSARQDRAQRVLRTAIPDAPEEQWDDVPDTIPLVTSPAALPDVMPDTEPNVTTSQVDTQEIDISADDLEW